MYTLTLVQRKDALVVEGKNKEQKGFLLYCLICLLLMIDPHFLLDMDLRPIISATNVRVTHPKPWYLHI